MLGNIPEKLLIIAKPTESVGMEWDDLEEEEKGAGKLDVRPAFVSDASNAKTIETGRLWAKGGTWGKEPVKGVKEIKVPNKPRKGYRIISLEKRSEGGRAWKVVSSDGFWFDLREDVLLDTLREAEVSKGEIKGEFIWARVGSAMKLVRVGSRLHTALIAATERRVMKKIGLKDLEAGGIYAFKDGSRFIFLGWVASTTYRYVPLKEEYRHYTYLQSGPRVERYQIERFEQKRVMLWRYLSKSFAKELKDFQDEIQKAAYPYVQSFEFKRSHTAIEKVGQEAVNLPKVLALLAEAASLRHKRQQEEDAKYAKKYPDVARPPATQAAQSKVYLSEYINLAPAGENSVSAEFAEWEKTQPIKVVSK